MNYDFKPTLALHYWDILDVLLDYEDEDPDELYFQHKKMLREGWSGIAINRVSPFELQKLRERYDGRTDVVIERGTEVCDTSFSQYEYMITETSAWFKDKEEATRCKEFLESLPQRTYRMAFEKFDPATVPEGYNWMATEQNEIIYFEGEDIDTILVTLKLTNTPHTTNAAD